MTTNVRGTATVTVGRSGGDFTGDGGSQTWVLTAVPVSLLIDGGTSANRHNGSLATRTAPQSGSVADALDVATDRILTPFFRPAAVAPTAATATGTDTNRTTGDSYNAQDILRFANSGDFSGLGGEWFTNIETIQLASGVSIRLSAEIFEAIEAYADAGAVNTGITFEGVAGGALERVVFDVEFELEGLVSPAVGDAYVQADVQLDDYSFANVFRNVQAVYDARDPTDDDDDEVNEDGLSQASFGRYFRMDGANEAGSQGELVYGSSGVDNATMRLGNDTYYGFDGNDLLIGHGGADYMDGGDGNDTFVIGGFGTGISGTTSKADDGKAEWVISAAAAAANSFRGAVTRGITNSADYGDKIDVIVGGAGFDTLRVTTGIGATAAANGTVVLNDANFRNMEKVEVGGTGSRDSDESVYQQIRDGHFYFARSSSVGDTATSAGGSSGNSIDKVVIDASGVTKNGLTFEGNANTQRFIGTTKADVFIGNEGADTLTGAGGADKFVFQTIREYARDSSTANGVIAYTPTDEAFDATDADTVTDFATGTDKVVFRVEATTALEDTFDSLVALTKGDLTATNVLIGDLTAIDTAGTATSFIKADTTGSDVKVYYDADGSGAGAAVLVVTLTNVATVGIGDFRLEAVQGF